jgi:hypothetical protein
VDRERGPLGVLLDGFGYDLTDSVLERPGVDIVKMVANLQGKRRKPNSMIKAEIPTSKKP